MKIKSSKANIDSNCLQEVQRKLECFEDDVLPFLPSKESILKRAKERQLKKKTLSSSVLAVFGLAVGVYWYNPEYKQFNVETIKGEQSIYVLSDGSKIHLNTDTEITVIEKIRSREIMMKQGEANFTVAHSAHKITQYFDRSFKVHAGDMEILDIGTVFNVLKHNDTDATVSVEQGEVAVKIKNSADEMLHLFQGQMLSNNKNKLGSIQKLDLEMINAWQSGEISFKQTRLINAIESFKRYSDFDVDIQNQQIKNLEISGLFKAKNYQQFMQVLPVLSNIKVEKITDKKWIIKKI
jgi:transmembrane sensor